MRLVLICGALAISLLTACTDATAPSGSDLSITRMNLSGAVLTQAQPGVRVARDLASLQALWLDLYSQQMFLLALPEIDFSQEMIVAVGIGVRQTSGFTVTVERASDSRGQVIIHATESSPGAGCAVLQVLTYPTAVVRLPRRNGDVSVDLTTVVRSCQ